MRVSASNIATYFQENGSARLFQPPTLENPALKLYGRADAIEVADGALYPVEIKGHKDVQPSDVLELAFYWRVLEPYRTRIVEPAGILILQRDCKPVEVRVPLRQRRFDRLDRQLQLQRLRDTRGQGVQPRLCPCTVCTGVARDEVLAAIASNRDLTLISGIRRTRASVLEEHCALATWDELRECDPSTVATQFASHGAAVTVTEVESWRLHALAYQTGTPAVFDPIEPFPVEGDYIALDLGYVSETAFVAHRCLCRPRRRANRRASMGSRR